MSDYERRHTLVIAGWVYHATVRFDRLRERYYALHRRLFPHHYWRSGTGLHARPCQVPVKFLPLSGQWWRLLRGWTVCGRPSEAPHQGHPYHPAPVVSVPHDPILYRADESAPDHPRAAELKAALDREIATQQRMEQHPRADIDARWERLRSS